MPKYNKQREMRAKARKRTHLKDLAYRQAIKACWLGDWLELNTDGPEKFKSHGHYRDPATNNLPGTPCIILP